MVFPLHFVQFIGVFVECLFPLSVALKGDFNVRQVTSNKEKEIVEPVVRELHGPNDVHEKDDANLVCVIEGFMLVCVVEVNDLAIFPVVALICYANEATLCVWDDDAKVGAKYASPRAAVWGQMFLRAKDGEVSGADFWVAV